MKIRFLYVIIFIIGVVAMNKDLDYVEISKKSKDEIVKIKMLNRMILFIIKHQIFHVLI